MILENLEGKIIKGKREYTIEKKIGEGGFGVVWQAHTNDTTVAVKTLLPAHYGDADQMKRFIQEGEVLQSFQHPHIIRTHDVGSDQGIYYIVTDFIEGGNLFPYIRSEKKMNSSQAKKIIMDIASALDYAHTQFKIIHRDVHPGNILLGDNGSIVLVDFGLAKVMRDSPSDTSLDSAKSSTDSQSSDFFGNFSRMAGTSEGGEEASRHPRAVIGHRHYCSPEALRKEGVTVLSDQFSLGQVAYELFSVIRDKRLVRVAAKAISNVPQERYSSIKEFIAAIKAVPDYLSWLQQKSKTVSGKMLPKEELEEICRWGEQGYREELTNKSAIQAVLEQIWGTQHDAYLSMMTEVEKTLLKEGNALSAQNVEEIKRRILQVQNEILPPYRKIKVLAGQK